MAETWAKLAIFTFGELEMKYCAFCKRINPGTPVYCQYCGRSFWNRICRHCREANPYEALTCRNCGSAELSETSGSIPLWMYFLNIKLILWFFGFILILGLIKNLDILCSFLIIGLIWGIGLMMMPIEMKKILNRIIKYLWNMVRRITG